MSRRFRVSQAARQDLDEIWLYAAAQSSEDAASRLIDSLTDRFPMLARMPASGRNREDLRPGLRSHPVGHYVIYYRVAMGRVEIVRVVHGAREVRRVFPS